MTDDIESLKGIDDVIKTDNQPKKDIKNGNTKEARKLAKAEKRKLARQERNLLQDSKIMLRPGDEGFAGSEFDGSGLVQADINQEGGEESKLDSSQEETGQKEEIVPPTISDVVQKNKIKRKAKLVDLARWRGMHIPK